MTETSKEQRERKKREVKLRGELSAFLEKLRAACKTFENATQWYTFVKPLEAIVEKNLTVLSPAQAKQLQDAMKLVDATIEGIKKSCGILQKELGSVIAGLAIAGAFLTPGIIAAIATGIVVVAVAAFLVIQNLPVQVLIRNQGCETISLGASVNLPGAALPREIPKNGEASATLPRVTITIAAKTDGAIQMGIANTPAQFSFATSARRIELDGVNLIGQTKTVNLGDGSSHVLVINCQ